MAWDTNFEMQILQAIEQHQGPSGFAHNHLAQCVEDDRYVEATRCVKRMYDAGLVTATTPPRQTNMSPSYGFILGGLTQRGRERLNELRAGHNPDP